MLACLDVWYVATQKHQTYHKVLRDQAKKRPEQCPTDSDSDNDTEEKEKQSDKKTKQTDEESEKKRGKEERELAEMEDEALEEQDETESKENTERKENAENTVEITNRQTGEISEVKYQGIQLHSIISYPADTAMKADCSSAVLGFDIHTDPTLYFLVPSRVLTLTFDHVSQEENESQCVKSFKARFLMDSVTALKIVDEKEDCKIYLDICEPAELQRQERVSVKASKTKGPKTRLQWKKAPQDPSKGSMLTLHTRYVLTTARYTDASFTFASILAMFNGCSDRVRSLISRTPDNHFTTTNTPIFSKATLKANKEIEIPPYQIPFVADLETMLKHFAELKESQDGHVIECFSCHKLFRTTEFVKAKHFKCNHIKAESVALNKQEHEGKNLLLHSYTALKSRLGASEVEETEDVDVTEEETKFHSDFQVCS
jgi:hypothetical protein